ncbi:MAG TPA: hypothetical protein ENH46_01960 [Candidatus Pacearchaeota archaeon]|nr:hypothetical protein [Candidatus Pacearchaeota archaeon]
MKRMKIKIFKHSNFGNETKSLNSRKAELTTQQIVLLIILIASFIVILFLLFRLNLGEITDNELCHNSVVMRGNAALSKDLIPLNCKTSYICITEDGTCEEMTKPDIKEVKSEEEVYQVLADEMADCWWMFGEGKVNYVSRDLTNENHCSICSQIGFDNSLYDEDFGDKIFETENIDKKKLYDYMEDNKISGKEINYYEYLYGVKNVPELTSQYSYGKINLEEQSYLVMGIKSKGTLEWVIAGGAILGVVATTIAIVSNPIGWTVGSAMVIGATTAGGGGGHVVGTILEGDSGDFYLRPTIIGANSEEFKGLNCSKVETLA